MMSLTYDDFLLCQERAFNFEFVGLTYLLENWLKMFTLSCCLDIIYMNNQNAVRAVAKQSRASNTPTEVLFLKCTSKVVAPKPSGTPVSW